MIKLEQRIVIVAASRHRELFRWQSKTCLELIDAGEIIQDHGVIKRVFTPALAFIVAEKERTVLSDGTAQSKPKLVLPQLVQVGCRQRAFGVKRVIAKIFVNAAMQVVASALGNNIYNAANGASCLHAVGVVDDTKLADGFLRWSCLLDTGGSGDIVSPIHGDEVVMNVLSGKGKLGHRFNDYVCAPGCGVPHNHARSQQSEVDELTPIHRQILNLMLAHHRVYRG